MDALINALDALITKKRHIKQGTMQQLLTGKKRLPGFSGDWDVKRVGGFAGFRSTAALTLTTIVEGEAIFELLNCTKDVYVETTFISSTESIYADSRNELGQSKHSISISGDFNDAFEHEVDFRLGANIWSNCAISQDDCRRITVYSTTYAIRFANEQ